MKKNIKNILACPNDGNTSFRFFGKEVYRDSFLLHDLEDAEILSTDRIKTGLIIAEHSRTAYPISEFVGVMLADNDVDTKHFVAITEKLVDNCPEEVNLILKETLQRLLAIQSNHEGQWNQYEMRYYDKEVSTVELREKMKHSIESEMHWRIFLPRRDQLINKIKGEVRNETVLEIGSGNSRTVARMFNPSENNYNYIGTDISFKRLLVAQSVIQQENFIQASALNLPFKKNCFKAIISFGMLHHLPRPIDAINHCQILIKTGGFFVFHEPIIRPEIPAFISKIMNKIIYTYDHSEHDSKIDFATAIQSFNQSGFKIESIYNSLSVFRSFIEAIIKLFSIKILHKKWVIQTLTFIDGFFLFTFCRLSKMFGPNAVYVVTRKEINVKN